MKGENPRLSLMATPELNRAFRAEANKRGLTIKDALEQAIHVWMAQAGPMPPPGLPKDMEPNDWALCAELLRNLRAAPWAKKACGCGPS